MAKARLVYQWPYVGPGQTVNVWIHGYAWNEFVTFSAVPIKSAARPLPYLARIEMKLGEVHIREDTSSIAYNVIVTNRSVSTGGPPTPAINVYELIQQIE